MTTVSHGPYRMRPLADAGQLERAYNQADILTLPKVHASPYTTGFVCSDRCLEDVQRLRYRVFNLELGAGLDASHRSGLDRDEFDRPMSHLVLVNDDTGDIVGTYRMQTVSHGRRHAGIYCATEFDLAPITNLLDAAVECGRACLEREHRSLSALMALWQGIGAFMNLHGRRYLFGCSSITTHDPDDGWRAMRTIRAKGYLHPHLWVPAIATRKCGPPEREHDAALGEALPLPKLFRTYMRLGARVISEPSLDRAFGTVVFLVWLDTHKVQLSSLAVVR